MVWNLEWDVWETLRDQIEQYRKVGVYRNVDVQDYAINALRRGLESLQFDLNKLTAPSIILPGEKR